MAASVSGVQYKLVPAACVCVLLAARVSLQSRLSSAIDNLCEEKIIIKRRTGKRYDEGGEGGDADYYHRTMALLCYFYALILI